MSNLQTRILTATILGAVALWLTWIGGLGFSLFSIAIGVAMFYEWVGLTATKQTAFSRIFGWGWLIITSISLVLDHGALLTIGVLIAGCLVLLATQWKTGRGWTATGLFYAGFSAISLSLLRGDEPFGFMAIIFLFAVVWSTDIAAYFTGRALGGPKLAPRFSPNKTWSGAIGGAVAAVASGVLVASLAVPSGNWLVPLLALLLSVVSQIGDLAESWVKRQFGAKDSGRLLPGHGGVLDRVDGLVAAAAVLYLFGALMAEPDVPSAMFFSF
ncbi:phosphatidate cytidylyltransferase [Falsochrobactrum sp. TDYN1]|uniref:Phosphatidate cytidylyltransferase n=1 Tax=Falsochrobactrum tianjinense TaxID=2706015 RepID=A0A949UVT4_9HYPH|nr:phosphatidate cytidylyltransferase [Falsochrobactrum sp. TDYN1]MBV2144601.1 phosphatidate cytidylyltransferase [Falsochrobactrum sp. TDYN1]